MACVVYIDTHYVSGLAFFATHLVTGRETPANEPHECRPSPKHVSNLFVHLQPIMTRRVVPVELESFVR